MAQYKAWNTTIASSDDKMPVLLAEANFYPGTTLSLEKQGGQEDELKAMEAVWVVPKGLRIKGVYEYRVLQPESVAQPQQITVHVLADGYGSDAVIGIVEDGILRLADSRRDGPYLVFEMNGSGEFAVLKPERNQVLWILAGIGAVLGGMGAVLAKKRKKKKGGTNTDQDKEDETGDGKDRESGVHKAEKEKKDPAGQGKDKEGEEEGKPTLGDRGEETESHRQAQERG